MKTKIFSANEAITLEDRINNYLNNDLKEEDVVIAVNYSTVLNNKGRIVYSCIIITDKIGLDDIDKVIQQ